MSELKAYTYDDMLDGNADVDVEYYLKSEADKAIADKDKEIAELKAMAKEPSVPSRSCRKCGSVGTLMYMPIVKDWHTYWGLYNNKGIDYVVGIQCAHCGEVAFVTKQTLEYELRKQKFKRCLAMASKCRLRARWFGDNAFYKKEQWALQWHRRWIAIAKKFKEDK